MSGEAVLTTGVPWFKVFTVGVGIVGSVAVGVYWWTSKIVTNNHQLALAKEEISILQTQKELMEKEKAEEAKCKKVSIRLKISGKERWGCFKENEK